VSEQRSKYFIDYGYYDAPEQTKPQFDPGDNALCPLCDKSLHDPVVTVSLVLGDADLLGEAISVSIHDVRSYFYRMHKECYENASQDELQRCDDRLIEQRMVELGKTTLDEFNAMFDEDTRTP